MERAKPEDVDLYESDFYSWTQTQAALLRTGRVMDADLETIAEEIETLRRSELSALRSCYRVLCIHLLERMIRPDRDGRIWTLTIAEQRIAIAQLLTENLGLKPKRALLFTEGYQQARKLAAIETSLAQSLFPDVPVFTIDQAEDESFWPQAGKLARRKSPKKTDD